MLITLKNYEIDSFLVPREQFFIVYETSKLLEWPSANQSFKDFDLFQSWTSLPVQDSAGGGTEEHAQRLRRACTRQRLPGAKEL